MPRRTGPPSDWPCFHAEDLERIPLRPMSGTSWAEWHLSRGEAERALRH